MKSKYYIIIVSFVIIFIVVLFKVQADHSAITTVKYFPPDKERHFTDAGTMLKVNKQDVTWTVASQSDSSMYLRHDIGLLYENGYFKGVQSKWKEQTLQIDMSQSIPISRSSMFKAISYHHGENHNNATITSIQKMTGKALLLQKKGQTFTEIPWKQIHHHSGIETAETDFPYHKWDQLMTQHNMNKNNYKLIPLTELVKYDQEPFPGFSQEKTNEIIGKLWEGLYKNYVLRLKEKENQLSSHPMPVILLSNEQTHLYVLFELNGHAEILLQQIN